MNTFIRQMPARPTEQTIYREIKYARIHITPMIVKKLFTKRLTLL